MFLPFQRIRSHQAGARHFSLKCKVHTGGPHRHSSTHCLASTLALLGNDRTEPSSPCGPVIWEGRSDSGSPRDNMHPVYHPKQVWKLKAKTLFRMIPCSSCPYGDEVRVKRQSESKYSMILKRRWSKQVLNSYCLGSNPGSTLACFGDSLIFLCLSFLIYKMRINHIYWNRLLRLNEII